MNSGFVKLYGSIVTSSIWLEPDHVLRLWIGMLALADANGEIGASVGGLAHACRLTKEKCAEGLAILEAPDPDSRSDVAEGRRVEKIPGGWRVINHRAYRDLRTPEQVKEAERKANYRAGQRGTVPDVPRTDAEIHREAEAETDTTTTPPPPRGNFLEQFLAQVPEPHVWRAEIQAMLSGMPGHRKPTRAQLESAAKDYLANGKGKAPNLRQFRRYVADAIVGEASRAGHKTKSDKASTSNANIGRWLAKRETTDAEIIENGD